MTSAGVIFNYIHKIFGNKKLLIKLPSKQKNNHGSIKLDFSIAKKIYLPKLILHDQESEERLSPEYWKIFNKGRSYYNRGWHEKAQKEFLKIYPYKHTTESYHTHLLRCYRKLLSKAIESNKYQHGLDILSELFLKCINYTSTDLRSYDKIIKLASQKNKQIEDPIKERISGYKSKIENEKAKPNFYLKTRNIALMGETKKPSKLKLTKSDTFDEISLSQVSPFLRPLPNYLLFKNNEISYDLGKDVRLLNHRIYRFNSCIDPSHFIVSTIDGKIILYNEDFVQKYYFDASPYSENHYHLRIVDLSSNFEKYLFTNIDKAYILDSNFNLLRILEVPYKDGWEKRQVDSKFNNADKLVTYYLQALGFPEKAVPSQKELKGRFRELVKKHHPDISSDSDDTKIKEIITAYEYLAKEDISQAFANTEDSYKWINTLNTIKYNIGNFEFSARIQFGSGEDWIYGSGFSKNGNKLYLCCYSGKTYEVDFNGNVSRVFIIPNPKNDRCNSSQIYKVVDFGDYLHFYSYYYLYIFKENELVSNIRTFNKELNWYDDGFVILSNSELQVFNIAGKLIGAVEIKNKVRNIYYLNMMFFIETLKEVGMIKINNTT